VEIIVECDPDHGMLIIVRDPGSGFDPEELPNPVVGERIFADHGRGVYLINQLMDEVRYERGGTEIWMRKR
jgi:serine/threonine-protein kinase RsbW